MEKIKKFLFGEMKSYKVQANGAVYTISGRRFKMHRDGMVTIYDGFERVASVKNATFIALIES